MIIALFPNQNKLQSITLGKEITEFLKSKKIIVVAEDEIAHLINAEKISSIDKDKIKFLISMGGDGTILRLSHRYKDLQAAIVGINLGHLGFMADITIPDIYPSLQDLLDGAYSIENRTVLEVVNKNNQKFYAANDIVIHRGAYRSLIEIALHVDGKYLNTFVADGIVIATPNGSTAYSLSAGGPILSPELDATVVTPICAHTISNRPFVLNADHEIQIQYLSKNPTIEMHNDGFDICTIETGDSLIIKKSKQKFRLVNLNRHDYFKTLRTKLGWSGKFLS